MNYPIPANCEEIIALGHQPVNAENLVLAIAAVVKMARDRGESLEELTEQVLEEDNLLDRVQRIWLSKIVAQAWISLA